MTPVLEWQFGGWLHGWPPAVAWSVLAALAVAGLGLVTWLYRRTLADLPRRVRRTLIFLRVALVLLLLLCLANPTRVERSRPEKPKRELAVLVDRSASMSQPDFRGTTRLADAVRVWKAHETEAAAAFATLTARRFATGVEAAGSFSDAVNAGGPGPETHLFAALRETLAGNPAAIVCLTDGLDTTAEKPDDLAAEALRRGVPLYFVAGKNRARVSGETLAIREVKTPAIVLRHSKFTASAVLEVVSATDGNVPVELWSGSTRLASDLRSVHAGLNSLPWSVGVTAGEPALMPLEFRLGAGARQQVASRTTRVVDHTKVDLLYYQGALQWGYRFLRGALESDPSFHTTAILNPALGVQFIAGESETATLTDLPEDARELKRFQIVVLAHAFADLMTPRQQQALVDYVRGGGGVLFISPDAEATRRFSGTLLEQMLPVEFEPPGAVPPPGLAEQRFQERMRALGGSSAGDESVFANEVIRRQTIPGLTPFVPVGAGMKLFKPGADAPQFCTYAPVRSVKPGAEILAVHPTDRSPVDNSPRVLLARQRFGDGFAAVMDTDLLWRWKLAIPSSSRAVETFWQQLMLSLAQPPPAESLQLVSLTAAPLVNHPVTVRISGAPAAAPAVITVSPQGNRQTLNATAVADGGPGVWQADFTPGDEGRWSVYTGTTDGDLAQITLSVSARAQTTELLNLPTDTEGLRRLAAATGGALIEGDAPVFRPETPADHPPEIVRAQAVWNNGWLALLLLGAYAAELVARRMFKLL